MLIIGPVVYVYWILYVFWSALANLFDLFPPYLPLYLSFDFPIDLELFTLIISNLIVILCVLTKAHTPRKQYVKKGKVGESFKEETSPAEWTLEILVVKVYGLFLCDTADNVFNRG